VVELEVLASYENFETTPNLNRQAPFSSTGMPSKNVRSMMLSIAKE